MHYSLLPLLRRSAASTTCGSVGSLRRSSSWRKADEFAWFLPMQTRWKDNDQYGHVNNAEFVSYYDTAINVYLIQHCKMKFGADQGPIIHFMVHTECDYFKPIEYPSIYVCGLAVSKVGNSSVSYKFGLFELPEKTALSRLDFVSGNFSSPDVLTAIGGDSSCRGSFTHVFVDSRTGKPVKSIEGALREGYERILKP